MPEAVPAELEYAFRLAEILASRKIRDRDDREDCAQNCRIALWGAWQRFEPARGLQWSTLAWNTAANVVRRFYRDSGGGRTRRAAYQAAQVRKGKPLRDGLTPAAALLPPLSLDATVEAEGSDWRPDLVPDPRPGPAEVVLWRSEIAATLAGLRPDLAAALVQHFVEGLTVEEVAARAGCRTQRAYRLLAMGQRAFVAAYQAQD